MRLCYEARLLASVTLEKTTESFWSGGYSIIVDKRMRKRLEPCLRGEIPKSAVPLNGGRGGAYQIRCGKKQVVIRAYRRGGLMARFFRDKYFLDSRPFKELVALQCAYVKRLPVPRPLGAGVTGLFWKSGYIAMEHVPGRDLAALRDAGELTTKALRRAGEVIRLMHESWIAHADLQVRNILAEINDVYLIDFDKAAVHRGGVPMHRRLAGLLRLERSFRKHGFMREDFLALLDGYGAILPSLAHGWRSRLCFTAERLKGLRSTLPRPKRIGMATVITMDDMNAGEVLDIVNNPETMLKQSAKSETWLSDEYIVKTSRCEWGLGFLKHTIFRERYRRAWRATLYLQAHGVLVPEPVAFIEWRFGGVIWKNALVTRYLDGFVTVEQFAARMRKKDAPAFLERLAAAVNGMERSGACHMDLSGKNILTRDGLSFWFIDLDSVRVGVHYSRRLRLKNHAQLYDSFIDYWDSDILAPFINAMNNEDWVEDAWRERVEECQRLRRERHEKRVPDDGNGADDSSD